MSEVEAEETMETEEVEPGEVPSMEVSVDKEVNVLDDILNSDTGQDAFQKELDNASNKTAAKGKKGKTSKVVAPKRKSTRKSKGTPAKATKTETKTDTKTEVKKLEVKNTKSEVKTTEKSENSQQETKTAQNTKETSAKASVSEKLPTQSKPKTENTTTEKKTSPKPTETKKSSKTVSLTALPTKSQDDTKPEAAVPVEKVSASPAVDKTQNSKVVKKTKSTTATTTTVSSASKKSTETKPKESKIPETLTPDESLLQQEILVKKVKDLEKLVAQTDAIEKERKSKEEKTSSSEKKRLSSSSSYKNKSKSSTKEKKSEAISKDVVVKSEVFSDGEDGKMDTTTPRSRSRSFSRSYSGSFTGSFSGSLSSFTGSNFSDLDSPRSSRHGSPSDNKSRKSKEDDEDVAAHKTFVESLLKGARYFIIKSNNHENVALSKAKGVWATPPANERKLNDAFKHSTNVILIFSVKESGRFQGFARLSSLSQHNLPPVPWVLPPGFDRNVLRGTFKVDWLNRLEVQFAQCSNLRNPWNENKEVKICRDGQEVEPSVGERLCSMFEVDHTVDLPRIAHHLKQNKPGGSGGGHHRGASAGPSRYSGPRGGGRGWRGRDRGRRGVGYNRRYSPKRGNGGGDRYEGRRGYYGGGGGDYRRRSRSRSYEHRRDSRRHRDKVKEFLKNDRSRFGVAKETLLNGSYSDYVREFQRQKQIQYTDPTRTAAEEFLRATHRR